VCPGTIATTESAPIPSATPPPAPSLAALVPIPQGIEPPPIVDGVPTPSREQSIAAWIAGPVRGHDNRMAAMRRVRIGGTEGAYTIVIDNQFGFRCGLDFDAAGLPSALRDCRSDEPDWHASPAVLAVSCAPAGFDLECQAPYQLGGASGYSSREIIVFRRRYD
jgi:hypothetical protein